MPSRAKQDGSGTAVAPAPPMVNVSQTRERAINVPVSVTVTLGEVVKAFTLSVPSVTVVSPEYVSTALSVSVPAQFYLARLRRRERRKA